MKFRKINNLAGWVIFAVAAITYLMTMERTASLWDCGEFLAASYKLEVAHSPGAPLFMIMGRVFSLFASDPTMAAFCINSMSAILSAFTILFLFWSITHFARKVTFGNDYEAATGTDIIKVIGAGIVGALAYTFSDTFWFSAVEAEVYASSSFFTAIVFWAALKWESVADQPHADRWMVLIFYLMGLSVGVHLLNLLTIPAIVLVYYFKRYKATVKGAIYAFFIGCFILAVLQFGIIQYLPIIASKFELLFTNSLGMPFNTGLLVFLICLIALVSFLLIYAKKNGKSMLQLLVLSFTFATIGYSSYVSVVIRSKADVPIDMNNPADIMALIPYLQRDQYGSQPLLSGPYFDSKAIGVEDGRANYKAVTKDGKDEYVFVDYKQIYKFDHTYFFPRIWGWMEPSHAQFYRQYLGLSKTEEPTAFDNYRFFFGYQVNWMYWRYFMWNYAGRQNDVEGQGEPQHGNWISGITFIDKMFGKGDANLLQDSLKNNKARNQLYFLPFLLGIAGMVYQYKRDKKNFTVIGLFFFFTGLAIQLYINNTPLQPRERDYAYVSTYAFAIWIGFGVIAVADLVNRFLKKPALAAQLATVLCLVAVPVLMASEEWDDHDRSKKTIARDHALNMLNNCDSNAILLTYGDNDTYPLWYLQEVEGYRTDVRIINYNLLGADWQNDQLLHKINKADAIPMLWGKNSIEVAYFDPNPKLANQYFTVEEILNYTLKDANKRRGRDNSMLNILPTRNFKINVDRNAVIQSGIISPKDYGNIVDEIRFTLPDQSALNRAELALLNLLAIQQSTGWKRPIYVVDGIPTLGLDQWFMYHGTVRKFVPIQRPVLMQGLPEYVDIDASIKLFTDNYVFGNANGDEVYYDEKNRILLLTYRQKATQLATVLAYMNRKEDALKVLNAFNAKVSNASLPNEVVNIDRSSVLMMMDAYYLAGDKASAVKYGDIAINGLVADMNYFKNLGSKAEEGVNGGQVQMDMQIISAYAQRAAERGDIETANRWGALIGMQPIAPQQAMPALQNATTQAQPVQ